MCTAKSESIFNPDALDVVAEILLQMLLHMSREMLIFYFYIETSTRSPFLPFSRLLPFLTLSNPHVKIPYHPADQEQCNEPSEDSQRLGVGCCGWVIVRDDEVAVSEFIDDV